MFEKGKYIICSNLGVCLIKDVTSKDINGVQQETLYYVLQPVNAAYSKVYSAVDNDKMKMRSILSKEEAEKFINHLQEVEALTIDNEKRREEIYKEALRACEDEEWAKLIKTLYIRKKEKALQKKKSTATDERYLKLAQDYLYNELAVALGVEEKEVEEKMLSQLTD